MKCISLVAAVSILGIHRILRPLPPVRTQIRGVRITDSRVPYFIKKVVRSSATRVSWITSFMLSMCITLLCHHYSIVDAGLLSFLTTLMVSLSATDVRGLCRRLRPPEITSLQGARTFMHAEFLAMCTLTIASTLPLLLYGTAYLRLGIVPALLLGLAISLPIGAIVASEQRDVSGQCIAELLCMVATVCTSKLTFVSSLNTPLLACFYLCLLTGLLFITAMTEYKRNPFIWRDDEYTQKH